MAVNASPNPLTGHVLSPSRQARVRTAASAASEAGLAFETALAWFERRGWQPFEFQLEVWGSYLAGESGLIHAPTGTGKTYAVWWATLLEYLSSVEDGSEAATTAASTKVPTRSQAQYPTPEGLRVLWLTPMRALAADTELALKEPLADLGLDWTVERRTGDTSSYAKARQLKKPPTALITTPESLSLLLSQANAFSLFQHLELVVVDEWHELLGNKRGVMAELCLARLRRWRPGLRTWGLSATLGNLDQAQAALLGVDGQGRYRPGRQVRGVVPKDVVIDSLIPDSVERFPWAGHMGLRMLSQVLDAIEEGRTALVFTNTRNQAERWYQAILSARRHWAGSIALHHGSLSADTRQWVEDGLRAGSLRCVVCTSSLDLGVDFSPVDRVLQIGSPKGVARLLQRAGRSGHQPGVVSRVTCVPTHALELVEVAAVRQALAEGRLEGRDPVEKPLDLLVQHLVTIGLGGGFQPQELLAEVRTTHAFHQLQDQEWDWALSFVTQGGKALRAYPEYRRVVVEDDAYAVRDREVASRHRLSIGTIVSDPAIEVRYVRGGSLGTITESFISRLQAGDKFIFAGKCLQFVRLQDLTAWVKLAPSTRGAIPVWSGTSLPISQALGDAVRNLLSLVGQEQTQAAVPLRPGSSPETNVWSTSAELGSAEIRAVQPILELQVKWSRLPESDELLIERLETADGHHLFFYPFAGKLVHQGLAALFAYRLSCLQPITFTLTANDYGFELLAPDPPPVEALLPVYPDPGTGIAPDLDPAAPALFSLRNLEDDIRNSLNASEMAKRQFREIARVAGLVFQGYPGRSRRHTSKYLQASSSLFYEVFEKYDQENLLLAQAHQEVLTRQLEASRLAQTLRRLSASRVSLIDIGWPTPLSFPLLVERMQALLSSETLADRVRRMTVQLEHQAQDEEHDEV